MIIRVRRTIYYWPTLAWNKVESRFIFQIPEGTDILVTHTPPVGFGDLCCTGVRAGCVELLNTVQQRVRPLYHLYGHIHEGELSLTRFTLFSLAFLLSYSYTVLRLHCCCTYNYFNYPTTAKKVTPQLPLVLATLSWVISTRSRQTTTNYSELPSQKKPQ